MKLPRSNIECRRIIVSYRTLQLYNANVIMSTVISEKVATPSRSHLENMRGKPQEILPWVAHFLSFHIAFVQKISKYINLLIF